VNLELDRFAHVESPLRRWDARWKLAASALFVVATVSLQHPASAVAAMTAGFGLVGLGRLPWGEVGRRIGPVVAIICVIAAVLAVGGQGPRTEIGGVPLSRTGLMTGLLVAAKALAVVTSLVALVSTSPAQVTLAALRRLHVPAGLVQVLQLAYRYVFLMHAELRGVQAAMRARGFAARADRRSLGVLGNTVGMLLIRSTERAERVYLAMQARGFDGTFPAVGEWRTATSDIVKTGGLAALTLGLVVFDIALRG
jgi:cobalt/nickel transport system permease protein